MSSRLQGPKDKQRTRIPTWYVCMSVYLRVRRAHIITRLNKMQMKPSELDRRLVAANPFSPIMQTKRLL